MISMIEHALGEAAHAHKFASMMKSLTKYILNFFSNMFRIIHSNMASCVYNFQCAQRRLGFTDKSVERMETSHGVSTSVIHADD